MFGKLNYLGEMILNNKFFNLVNFVLVFRLVSDGRTISIISRKLWALILTS